MAKDIDFRFYSDVYLKRREKINVKELNIGINGVIINAPEINNLITSEKLNSEKELKVNINDFEKLKISANEIADMINVSTDLGRYVYLNDFLKEIATNYVAHRTLEQQYYISMARPEESVKVNINYKLPNKYKNLNVDDINNSVIKKVNPKKLKFINSVNFKKKLIKWINIFGLSDDEIQKINGTTFMSIEDLLSILDACVNIYNLSKRILDNAFSFPAELNLTSVIYKQDNVIKQFTRFNNIIDLCTYFLLFHNGEHLKHIKICEFCGEPFIAKNLKKKCCSNSCKDKKNNKYEKRKAREAENLRK